MIFHTIRYLTVLLCIFSGLNIKASDFTLGLGNLTEHVGRVQTDESGNKNTFTFNPYLKAALDYEIYKNWIISPEIATTFPKTNGDPNTHHMSFMTLINGKYAVDSWQFILGTGFFFTRIWGSDGEEILSNGTGTTSFPLPDHAEIARNVVVNLGFNYKVYQNYHFELHSIIANPLTAIDRSFSIGLNVNYHFGEVF